MRKRVLKKTALTLILILCVTAVVLAFSACGSVKSETVAALNSISNPSDNYELHCTRQTNLTSHTVLSSGFIELMVDTENCSFSIKQTDESKEESEHYWSALPILPDGQSADKSLAEASVVSIDILGKTDIYKLNSQDNSVAYKKARYELIENGAVFTYDIFADEQTAKKVNLSQSDIAFSVKLTVTLRDGSMYADCSYSNLSGNPDAYITDINVLNRFGAYNESSADDFLFVPDGCGAIIKTSVHDDSFEQLSFPVYGNDIAISGGESAGNVIVPAFGMKHSGSAFVALITKGDAVATIHADKATDSSEYNTVNSSFCITPYKYENNRLTVSKHSIPENEGVSLCYRFVSGNNASYSGLASSCREQLIRNAVLSTRSVNDANGLPFNLTVIGTKKTDLLGYFSRTVAVTNTEQASDMVTRMKNKGINNINLRYLGIFSGGLNQKDITSSNILLRLGFKHRFDNLFTYIDTQNMNLFFDIDILGASSGLSGSEKAQTIDGNYIKADAVNPYSSFTGADSFKRSFRSISKIENLAEKILIRTRNNGFSGFCVNDAGTLLYSDYSYSGFTRADAQAAVSEAVVPLTTNKITMISGGNFYMLKNANVIVNLPLTTSVTSSGAYEAVPFVQLILHGSLDYSGTPVNIAGSCDETMLKYIEYGACPCYEWGYNRLSDKDDVYYYDTWVNSAAVYYAKANEVLGDLRGTRITSHEMISDGVFLTEYENGSLVYVNYTDKDFTVSGVMVGGRDFERVN